MSSDDEFSTRKLGEDELWEWNGALHLPNFSQLPNRIWLIEAKMQRKRMKKKEVRMNCLPFCFVTFMVT